MQAARSAQINRVTKESTFIKENTLTSCSFNMADISMSSLAASNWFTLDIEIGIMTCTSKKRFHPTSTLYACNHHAHSDRQITKLLFYLRVSEHSIDKKN
jgi:hypothetical protein